MSLRSAMKREVLAFWKAWVVVLLPLLSLPLPLLANTTEAWSAYGIIIIAGYWMTEALPMAATALLPTVLFPLFGVLDTAEVSAQYMSKTNLLFLAGLIVAVAVEKSNFHTRAALTVVLSIGSGVKWLMLGFMFTTMFFSMWMSNTATTAMVTPMMAAVITSLTEGTDDIDLEKEEEAGEGSSNDEWAQQKVQYDGFDGGATQSGSDVGSKSLHQMDASTAQLHARAADAPAPLTAEQLRPPLYLCVAYAANCGGMGTLTGTAPNLVLRGVLQQ